jgi:hypothetical protein
LRILGVIISVAGLPGSLCGQQFFWGMDAGLNSRYVWRGRTLRNAVVTTASGYVGITTSRWSLSSGVSDPTDPSGIGFGRRIGEIDPWIEASYRCSLLDVTLGVTRHHFRLRNARGFDGVANSTELYTRFDGQRGIVGARIVTWTDLPDFDRVFAEISGWIDLPVLPAMLSSLRAGLTGRLNRDPALPAAPALLSKEGLSSAELFLTPQFSIRLFTPRIYVSPTLRVQRNVDSLTAVVAPSETPKWKAWLDVVLSIHR